MKTSRILLPALITVLISGLNAGIGDGLVAHYPLDGNAVDVSGNGNDGTVSGPVAIADRYGRDNSAYYFDGVDDFIVATVSSLPVGASPRSISLWARANPDPTRGMALAHWGAEANRQSFGIIMNSSPLTWQGMTYGGGNDVNSGVVADNNWHHLVVTYGSSSLQIHIDGSLRGSKAIGISTGNSVLTIGAVFGGVRMLYDGIIDEVRVYDRVISSNEINELHCLDTPLNLQDGLEAFYPLDGDGLDESGNEHHATTVNVGFGLDRFGNVDSAATFNGIDQYIQIATRAFDFPDEVTFSGWINFTAGLGIWGPRIYSIPGWEITTAGTGAVRQISHNTGVIGGAGTTITSAGSYNAGEWHHVCAVREAGTMNLYVNGVLQAFHVLPGTIDYSVGWYPTIGTNSGNLSYDRFGGSIDDVRLYSRGLSPCEVEKLYAIESDPIIAAPPTANAGPDFSVNEGQVGIILDGSGSSDPDDDPLAFAWLQLGGTEVTLSDAAAAQPTFDAPLVAIGGETLTFELTVSANGKSDVDSVDVTVVNVNHPPVADAGDDQSIAEGAPVTLHGEDSFDVDNDTFAYLWVQVDGSPTVTLTGAITANPIFEAPFVAAGGAPGVVATLVFELTVDDGFPQDAPAPGYSLTDVTDSVTIEVTNTNNDPIASAGVDQTVDETTPVALDGGLSSDPDSDALTYSWIQIGGAPVLLADHLTVTPSFIAPFVNAGGQDLTFKLTVDDGFGGSAFDTVVIHVQSINDPPLVSAAYPTTAILWPPNHSLVTVGIAGVSDPDNNAIITIDSVWQDEPTEGQGDGDTAVDAVTNEGGTVLLRAERSGEGDGRVYHIHFTASDLEGSASGIVIVTVPHNKRSVAIDGGELYNSAY